jgi:hypothetical protein
MGSCDLLHKATYIIVALQRCRQGAIFDIFATLRQEAQMDEFFQKVTSQVDPFKRLASYIPGFGGYVERQNRRDADKLLRDTVARRFDEQWKRASQLQVEMVNNGMIQYVDDMERAALQLRTFIDKISTAPRGYSGLFDAVKINEKELEAIYQYDAAFFDLAEQVGRALDNVEASLGDEAALPAAIRNVIAIARMAVETYNRRSEVVIGDGK